jgi:SAM-dependent methyltransferase
VKESTDYFSNHRLKLRFPWSLYHRPIVRELQSAIAGGGPDVLNIGSGPFYELPELARQGRRFTICDIDARAIELAKALHGAALHGADVLVRGNALPYAASSFDTVVSMDVIEHLSDPVPWLRGVLRVLRPGGLLFLTTPNYASASLSLIETTVLEAIARLQGFSRRELHPTKLTPNKLRGVFERVGARDPEIKPIAFGWVLAAYLRR